MNSKGHYSAAGEAIPEARDYHLNRAAGSDSHTLSIEFELVAIHDGLTCDQSGNAVAVFARGKRQ